MYFDCVLDIIINIYYEWYQVLKHNPLFCDGRKWNEKGIADGIVRKTRIHNIQIHLKYKNGFGTFEGNSTFPKLLLEITILNKPFPFVFAWCIPKPKYYACHVHTIDLNRWRERESDSKIEWDRQIEKESTDFPFHMYTYIHLIRGFTFENWAFDCVSQREMLPTNLLSI